MDNENWQEYSISHFSENEQNFLSDLVHETLIDAGFKPELIAYELKVSFVESEE